MLRGTEGVVSTVGGRQKKHTNDQPRARNRHLMAVLDCGFVRIRRAEPPEQWGVPRWQRH
jgi:hypothetical protein